MFREKKDLLFGELVNFSIVMGDWNSVVGDESYRNVVGPHGLGRKNHRGEMLINFCEKKD
jgi:hypothetical protein